VNRLTETFLDESANGQVRTRAKELRDLLPPAYAESYGALLLGRPLLVPHEEMVQFATDLTDLFAVLTSLPERCFDGDPRRYGRALGLDERLLTLMTIGATGQPPLYARADAFHDGESFKLLELNVGSELGGIDAAQLNRAFLRVPSFRAFADRHGLAYLDTSHRLAELLRRAAAPVTTGDPVVALVEGTGGLADHQHVFVAIQEALRDHGVELLLTEIDRLDQRDGKVVVDGTPIDVVLRYFAAEQLTGPADQARLELLAAAHAAGRTALFTPLEGALFASKASLGLLHDPRVRARLTEAERRVVDRLVPWTRVVSRADDALTPADRAELIAHCRARRESLVLKPGIGYGGVGVVVGREVSDRVWHDHLVRVQERDYVVQQLVVPAAEPVVDEATGAREDWYANWGVFVTEAGYAGAFVRALRPHDGSVISYSNPGTRGTCVFTYPAHRRSGAMT
jgi:hypothetical protein